jgi:hypothetical protein
MCATISKKEIIFGHQQSVKNLDEIQATLRILFEDDLKNSIKVNFFYINDLNT